MSFWFYTGISSVKIVIPHLPVLNLIQECGIHTRPLPSKSAPTLSSRLYAGLQLLLYAEDLLRSISSGGVEDTRIHGYDNVMGVQLTLRYSFPCRRYQNLFSPFNTPVFEFNNTFNTPFTSQKLNYWGKLINPKNRFIIPIENIIEKSSKLLHYLSPQIGQGIKTSWHNETFILYCRIYYDY